MPDIFSMEYHKELVDGISSRVMAKIQYAEPKCAFLQSTGDSTVGFRLVFTLQGSDKNVQVYHSVKRDSKFSISVHKGDSLIGSLPKNVPLNRVSDTVTEELSHIAKSVNSERFRSQPDTIAQAQGKTAQSVRRVPHVRITSLSRAGTNQGVQRWKLRAQNGSTFYTSTSAKAPALNKVQSLSALVDSRRNMSQVVTLIVTSRGTVWDLE